MYRCLKENCEGELIKSNRMLLSYPVQYQYKCPLCNTRYLRTDGEENLHLHFYQQYGGD